MSERRYEGGKLLFLRPTTTEAKGAPIMDRHGTRSVDIPKWSALLVEAVNKPGMIMEAYSAFHSYSIGNQILAMVQCQMRGLEPGPINTLPGWQALGRSVKRGERALILWMPTLNRSLSPTRTATVRDTRGNVTSRSIQWLNARTRRFFMKWPTSF